MNNNKPLKIEKNTILAFLINILIVSCPFLLIDIIFRAASGIINLHWKKYFILSVGQSILWCALIASIVYLFPRIARTVLYWILLIFYCVYSIAQFIYCSLFQTYFSLKIASVASEGLDYASDVTRNLNIFLILGILIIVFISFFITIKVLLSTKNPVSLIYRAIFLVISFTMLTIGTHFLPNLLGSASYQNWDSYEKPRYIYDHFLIPTDCMKYAGIYEFIKKDCINIYNKYYGEDAINNEKIAKSFFESANEDNINPYTGLLKDKNVIFVMMESIDDWLINENDTPTICKMMNEGINFTNFYSPMFGSGATFNTEFAVNTGLFSPSTGESASGYIANSFNEALPWQFKNAGYTANSFHYNIPEFYNRDKLHKAFGYENYYCYQDYVDETVECRDDAILVESDDLYNLLCPDNQKFFSFVITYSGHLPYEYSYELCQYGFEKFPECKQDNRSETVNCAEVRARMTDSMFDELLRRLENDGLLEDTVIVAFTDHYTYAIDSEEMSSIQAYNDVIEYEKTPFFIYGTDISPATVDKVCSTQDMVPTILNLMGMSSTYKYIGHDIFSDKYHGYAIFPNGSWITNACKYNGNVIEGNADEDYISEMNLLRYNQIQINDAILFTDYYKNY